MDYLEPSPVSQIWDVKTTHLSSDEHIYKSEPMGIVSLFSASLESKAQFMVEKRCPLCGYFCFSADHTQTSSQHEVLKFLKTATYPWEESVSYLVILKLMGCVCIQCRCIELKNVQQLTFVSREAGLVCLADTWCELGTAQARVIGSFWIFAVIPLISWGTAASLDSLLPGGRNAFKRTP